MKEGFNVKKIKTNAMRQLEQQKIQYTVNQLDKPDGHIDGVEAAKLAGEPVASVYKTLVTTTSKDVYVFVIPVSSELDMKKAAQAVQVKKLEMLPLKDLQKTTGYVRGGCSPIGMKKLYTTVIDKKALELDVIIVSGGQVGVQIKLEPAALIKVINGTFEDVVKDA